MPCLLFCYSSLITGYSRPPLPLPSPSPYRFSGPSRPSRYSQQV
jgi:hypothetical protein